MQPDTLLKLAHIGTVVLSVIIGAWGLIVATAIALKFSRIRRRRHDRYPMATNYVVVPAGSGDGAQVPIQVFSPTVSRESISSVDSIEMPVRITKRQTTHGATLLKEAHG